MTNYHVPLGQPPLATQIAIGVHGPGTQSFCLSDRWCLHFYTYHAQLVIDGETLAITPGSVGLTPAGTRTIYHFPSSGCAHTFAHFRLPIDGGQMVSIARLTEVGARFELLNRLLMEAVGWFPTNPTRANARLWDVLWSLSNRDDETSHGHVAVERARHYIERNLANQMRVPAIAKYAGCSPNHLVRLFQAQVGLTVMAHVRRRRAERAMYLLRHSNISIKTIPKQIGITDIQMLNKLIRREFGQSPREIRLGDLSRTESPHNEATEI
jgi:AraC-like DNA-binding protein